ncbi:MAG: hypothetical protein DRR19_15030 [Candidatus Parabeggiatoa sp. nov. 1]|nr:MAG: hypothetical protein DRR19_15030 [Gammaproteobacteria bacterium]
MASLIRFRRTLYENEYSQEYKANLVRKMASGVQGEPCTKNGILWGANPLCQFMVQTYFRFFDNRDFRDEFLRSDAALSYKVRLVLLRNKSIRTKFFCTRFALYS